MEHTQDAKKQMALLLDSLCTYYNHDAKAKEANKNHSSSYMRNEDIYWQRIMYYLPLLFKGREKKEIYKILLECISEEL